MEFTHSRFLWQILLSVAGLVCFVTAISWIRATYKIYKAGEARPLLLPFPAFMVLDISMAVTRMINRNGLPSSMNAGLEKVRFESIMSGNYVKAFMLLIFSLIAVMMAYRLGR